MIERSGFVNPIHVALRHIGAKVVDGCASDRL
jgi:hypothetical protein